MGPRSVTTVDSVPAEPRPAAPSLAEAWLTVGVLFLFAAVIRAVAAAFIRFPVPEDTAYYVGVARNFVDGHGLVSNSLWSYQTQPLVVPRAAFEVWMPLPTFIAAIPIAIAGTAHWFRAAQVSSVLMSAAIPALAWRTAVDAAVERGLPAGRVRLLGFGAGAVAAVIGPLVAFGALPDSTTPFAVLVLTGCLLMNRLSAAPRGARDLRLLALGMVFGLAILTRSEALWLGLAWVLIVRRWTPDAADTRRKALLIATPAAVAGLIYLPWAVRDWQAFGTPLPGQTVANALYSGHMDIFAYTDPPTLGRYLAQGPATLLQQHVAGFVHDIVSVLVTQGFPIGIIGLVALPLVWRLRSLRPLLVSAALIFTITSLLFLISTQSGTFLHAAGAIYVLLAISCLFGLDALIARIGRFRHWTRPVAWLGPTFAVFVAIPLSAISVASLSKNASDVQTRYDQLVAATVRAGVPLTAGGPVIANFPVWLAESTGSNAIALPDEPPDSVLALARRFGSTLVVLDLPDPQRQLWTSLGDASPAGQCFSEVRLTDNSGRTPPNGAPLAGFHVFRIVCR